MRRFVFLTLAAAFFASGCATAPPPDQVAGLLDQAVIAARAHMDRDEPEEASILLGAAERVGEEHEGVTALRADLGSEVENINDRPLLGSNRSVRPAVKRSLLARSLLYLPDRLLDLLDVVSLDVGFGPGAFANIHATRGLQAGGGLRATGGIGLHNHRSIGLLSQTEAGVNVLGAGAQVYAGALVGTSGVVTGQGAMAGLHRPSAPLYRDFRDYWAVGTGVTAILVSADADFHPVQLVDFLAGFVGVDFLNDDFAHTRGLRLNGFEKDLIAVLSRVKAEPPTEDVADSTP